MPVPGCWTEASIPQAALCPLKVLCAPSIRLGRAPAVVWLWLSGCASARLSFRPAPGQQCLAVPPGLGWRHRLVIVPGLGFASHPERALLTPPTYNPGVLRPFHHHHGPVIVPSAILLDGWRILECHIDPGILGRRNRAAGLDPCFFLLLRPKPQIKKMVFSQWAMDPSPLEACRAPQFFAGSGR